MIMARRGVRVSGEDRRYGVIACPLCFLGVKWSCGADTGDYGEVHCQNGRHVSQPVGPGKEPCTWSGAACQRRRDGSVVITKQLRVRP
jgi:hypothetical protein